MKNFIKIISAWAAVAVGVNAGNWLWDEVLADKVDSLRDSIREKFSREDEA